jgi:hypothetical protein
MGLKEDQIRLRNYPEALLANMNERFQVVLDV